MVFRASSRRAQPAWRRVLVCLSLAIGCFSGAVAQDSPISLPEDVLPGLRQHLEHALRQAPAIQLSNLQLAHKEASYLVARSVLLPQVGINANYSTSRSEQQDVPSSQTDDDGFFYALGLSQPVFHWGALKAQRDIAAIETLVSQNELSEARRRLAQAVRSQYLGLVIRRMNLRNQEFGAKLNEQAWALTEERFKNGQMSSAEYEGAQLGLAEARHGLALYHHDWNHAVRLFGRTIGDSTFDGQGVPAELPRPAYDPAALAPWFASISDEQLLELPTARTHELRIAQEDKRYQIARAQLLPKVSLNASYGLTNLTSATAGGIQQTGVLTTTAGVGVNWALFDGFAARGNKRAALIAKRMNERNLEQWIETTLIDLRRIQNEIQLTVQQLAFTERRYELVQEGVTRTEADLAAGRAAQANLDASIRQARDIEVSTARVRAQLMNQWVEFLSVSGQDPALGVPPPSPDAPSGR